MFFTNFANLKGIKKYQAHHKFIRFGICLVQPIEMSNEIKGFELYLYKILDIMSKEEEFYVKLKGQLLDTATWPSIYLYKFIIPTDPSKIVKIQDIFNNMGAVIDTKVSKTKKYTSVSIKVRMASPDAVIEKYREVALKIEGVISL